MGHQVANLLPDHPVVEVRYFGHVTAADLTEAFTECVVKAMELDTWLLLADCTDLAWAPTITDLKDLVDALSALGMTERFREAVVRPTDITAAVSVGFWETAGVNRGLAIRTFRTRTEALGWLEEEPVAGGGRLVPASE
jgi:hypothetical protein